jgi:hypothetical protein
VGIDFSIFLFVIGAILTFAVGGDTVVEERRIERDLP